MGNAQDLLDSLLETRERGFDLTKMEVGVHGSIGSYDIWDGDYDVDVSSEGNAFILDV
jgi:hypothetical protein